MGVVQSIVQEDVDAPEDKEPEPVKEKAYIPSSQHNMPGVN